MVPIPTLPLVVILTFSVAKSVSVDDVVAKIIALPLPAAIRIPPALSPPEDNTI